jgi:hypothetical protein
MKEASVKNSYDLEHLKNLGLNLFNKGLAKKIYIHLHRLVKGDDSLDAYADGKFPGPGAAPG